MDYNKYPKYSHLRIEINDKCNLNCSYCRSNSGEQYKNSYGKLSKEKIFEIIDEAEKLGFEIIVITGGGEPFLRDDLFEIIEYGNLPKVILTNGTLLNENIVSKLSKSKLLSYIKISFDGYNAQKKLRGENTLNKIINAMKLLEINDIPYAINTVLTNESLEDIEEFYEVIANSKAFSWGIYPLISQGRACDNHIKYAEIDRTTKKISNILEKYINDECPFYLEIEGLFIPELLNKDFSKSNIYIDKINHPCIYQLNAITIRLNGDVSQCSRLQESFGNIYTNSLEEILYGKKRTEFIKRKIEDCNDCNECDFVSFCQGGCLGRKQLLNIPADKADYIACEYAKAFSKYIYPLINNISNKKM